MSEANRWRCSPRAARASSSVCAAADALRADSCGERVSYVVNRNINYTNICTYRCTFCAFSKGKRTQSLRGRPYDLDLEEIAAPRRRGLGARRDRSLPAGRHPSAATPARPISRSAAPSRRRRPDMHIHAFSPLEISQGAATLGTAACRTSCAGCKDGGPGLAARHRGGDPRRRGARGHLSRQAHDRAMARRDRDRASRRACAPPRPSCSATSTRRGTGRATSCASASCRRAPAVSPNSCRCRSCRWRRRCSCAAAARFGPTFREAVLMHAVARLALHPLIPNIQTSWVKMGPEGAAACLRRRRQRPRRHADERKHYARRRRRARPGNAAGDDGDGDPLARPRALAAHDALSGDAAGSHRRLVRRAAIAADGGSARAAIGE